MKVDFAGKDKLTPLERMGKLMANEPIDRVAFNSFAMGFAARISGMDRGTYYRNPERAFEACLSLMKAYPWTNSGPRLWVGRPGGMGIRRQRHLARQR